ncbi:MAG: ribosomal protein S18-alanine N-acetyltransferase [Lachnospiraceae bacterium]|nr:ribosomal protein S18-alanine N-acetyltransferase [Lachnospiraceae bacterium]
MQIRRMLLHDVPGAVQVEEACFSTPWSEKVYTETIANENALYLIAVEEETQRVIATCGFMNILGEGDISNVAVLDAYRGQGIASRMMEELLCRGKELGMTQYILEVRASNTPAIGLYEKFGFSQIGRRRLFYEHPSEDALIMQRIETP